MTDHGAAPHRIFLPADALAPAGAPSLRKDKQDTNKVQYYIIYRSTRRDCDIKNGLAFIGQPWNMYSILQNRQVFRRKLRDNSLSGSCDRARLVDPVGNPTGPLR